MFDRIDAARLRMAADVQRAEAACVAGTEGVACWQRIECARDVLGCGDSAERRQVGRQSGHDVPEAYYRLPARAQPGTPELG